MVNFFGGNLFLSSARPAASSRVLRLNGVTKDLRLCPDYNFFHKPGGSMLNVIVLELMAGITPAVDTFRQLLKPGLRDANNFVMAAWPKNSRFRRVRVRSRRKPKFIYKPGHHVQRFMKQCLCQLGWLCIAPNAHEHCARCGSFVDEQTIVWRIGLIIQNQLKAHLYWRLQGEGVLDRSAAVVLTFFIARS